MNNNSIASGCLVEEYRKGRAILLKTPSSRSQGEIEHLKQWLLEKVKLFSSLQLNKGMTESFYKKYILASRFIVVVQFNQVNVNFRMHGAVSQDYYTETVHSQRCHL